MKHGYCADIEKITLDNADFRRVIYTGEHLQLVLMTLAPGEEIGAETHSDRDQFFRFEEGVGEVEIDNNRYSIEDGSAVIVPAGARHNVRNAGEQPLKLYTLYGPPEHKDGIVQSTRAEAEARHMHEKWDGVPTEQ